VRTDYSISHLFAIAAFSLFCIAPLSARTPDLTKYPLRVHIISADKTDRIERMKPGESVACDAIGDMTSSISPNPGGSITLSGVFTDPCTFGATEVAGRQLDINNGYVYSGEGRADLVAPPSTTQGLSFSYRNCERVRVLPGFQSLPARWKKPGQLEVLLPSDEIPVNGREPRPQRCTLTAKLHDFVYLLLRNGQVFQVSQEIYWKYPAMRAFLRGKPETVEQRVKEFTVSAPKQ